MKQIQDIHGSLWQFSCCAVNTLNGTVNDFDNSPWITSGSAGSKEIPTFCCVGVTQASFSTFNDTSCTDTVTANYQTTVRERARERERMDRRIDKQTERWCMGLEHCLFIVCLYATFVLLFRVVMTLSTVSSAATPLRL